MWPSHHALLASFSPCFTLQQGGKLQTSTHPEGGTAAIWSEGMKSLKKIGAEWQLGSYENYGVPALSNNSPTFLFVEYSNPVCLHTYTAFLHMQKTVNSYHLLSKYNCTTSPTMEEKWYINVINNNYSNDHVYFLLFLPHTLCYTALGTPVACLLSL